MGGVLEPLEDAPRWWGGNYVASPAHFLHPHTDLARRIWRATLKEGDVVVDATAGNGHDTLTLVHELDRAGGGTLWACDIQDVAIAGAQERLRSALQPPDWQIVTGDDIGMYGDADPELGPNSWDLHSDYSVVRVHWRVGDHQDVLRMLDSASVRLIVFNLGYLPGADKSLVTTAEGTVLALSHAERALVTGGTVSVTIYPGHEEGAREEVAVLDHASQLRMEVWSVYHHQWLNQRNKKSGRRPPSLLLIQRLHLGPEACGEYCKLPKPKCDGGKPAGTRRLVERLAPRGLDGGVLEAGVASDADAWFAEWRERLECWWVGLPSPARSELASCLGALGLHVGSRFDSWRAAQFALKNGASTAPEASVEPGCEWLVEPAPAKAEELRRLQLNLPPFPEADASLLFESDLPGRLLPPVPRLLPSWERLLSLTQDLEPGSVTAFATGGPQPAERHRSTDVHSSTPWSVAMVAGGSGGVAAAVALAVFVRACKWQQHGSSARPALRRPALQS